MDVITPEKTTLSLGSVQKMLAGFIDDLGDTSFIGLYQNQINVDFNTALLIRAIVGSISAAMFILP